MPRILIVDRSEDTRAHLATMLAAHGHVVEFAHQGTEALRLARQNPPDLVIAPLFMPASDGELLLQQWQGDKQLGSIPFLALAPADPGPESEPFARSLGAAVIPRNPNAEDLLTAVGATLASAPIKFPATSKASPSADGATTVLPQGAAEFEAVMAAQRRQMETLTAILDALPAHIALVDAHGVILLVNEAWRRFSAANVLQSSDFCVGQNYLQVCERATGDCSSEAREAGAGIRSVLNRKAPLFSLEYPCHSPTERLWYRLMVSPLTEDPATGAVIMHVNVTERREAEDRLRLSEANLAASQQIAHLGSWELDLVDIGDLRGGGLRWSNEVFRIWGHEPGAITVSYENFLATVHPDDRALIGEAVAAALRENRSYDVVHRIIRPDGTQRVVREQAVFQFEAGSGRPVRMIGTVHDITERWHAEIVMASTLERLNEAQRVGKIGDWEWDIASDAISWSPQVRGIFDLDPGVDLPRTFAGQAALYDAASWVALQETVRQAIATGQAQDCELAVPHAAGPEQVMHATVVARVDPRGKITRLYGTIQDVTRQKQAEAQAVRLAAIVESSDDAIIGKNPDGIVTSWNHGAEKIFGYRAEEMIGASITRIMPAGRKTEEVQILEKIRLGLNVQHYESIRQTKDGRLIDISATVSPIRDEAGKLIGISKVARDITERKRVERRFRRLVESNVHGVYFWQDGRVVTDANEAFLKMTGYTREDLAAGTLKWTDLTPSSWAQLDQQALAELASAGVCTPYEKMIIHRNKSQVPVLVGAASFEDNPAEGVCFVLDLSERKKLEQQFLRAQRMESIGTLAGGIAHDLNNILAPILMIAPVLAEKMPDAQDRELMAMMQKSARRGSNIIKQILTFSRGVEGTRGPVQIRHLVKEMIEIIKETFPREVTAVANLPDALWPINADATQIHQVLMNLCVNARDAMPGGGQITILVENTTLDLQTAGLQPSAKPGQYVRLTVSDTGAGISQENLGRIFEPFFTTKEFGKGTGLGLSTVLGIVQSHGGFVTTYSELGHGTSFRIHLPVAADMTDPAAGSSASPERGANELILLVDDEPLIRQSVALVLRSNNYRVLEAADGTEATNLFLANRKDIQLVLTDIMMPGMNGVELVRTLRRIEPHIRVVVASGLHDKERNAGLATLGISTILTKPMELPELLHALRLELTAKR